MNIYVVKARKLGKVLLVFVLVWAALWLVLQPSSPESTTSGAGQEGEAVVKVVAVEESTEVVQVTSVPTKFAEYRLEREQIRSRQIELLENVVYDEDASEERKHTAQQSLLELIKRMTNETELENLLRAKGYIDVVVVIGEHAATVVVPVALTQEEAARIGEVVSRMTGVQLDTVTIVDELSRT